MGRSRIIETKQERNHRYYLKHKEKRLAAGREYRKKFPEKRKEAARKERIKNAARYKAYSKQWHQLKRLKEPQYHSLKHLQTRYGITPDVFFNLQISQDFKCAICGIPETEAKRKRLFVDHDHKTGKVRKLLCDPCNRLLADAREDITILEKAIAYLKDFSCISTALPAPS